MIRENEVELWERWTCSMLMKKCSEAWLRPAT